ncbi:MAG: hypothetical protein R3B13_02835 [Polyangiaceae bacterium]
MFEPIFSHLGPLPALALLTVLYLPLFLLPVRHLLVATRGCSKLRALVRRSSLL